MIPQNLITPAAIDFSAYYRETEASSKVRPAGVYVQDMIDTLGQVSIETKAFLPWEKTHSLFSFRPGEVTLWAGVNGHGKSLISGMAALSLMGQDEKVCIASFEMKPRRTLDRMIRQWTSESPHGLPDDERVHQSFRKLYGDFKDFCAPTLWFYDQQGTADPSTVIGVARYCAKELGIQHIFIDSLMKVIPDEDDHNGQKRFVDELTAIARDYGTHIHLISHIRKLSNEEVAPGKHDVKGTGAITDLVDNLLLVYRNKKKENAKETGGAWSEADPDTFLICAKQRNGEWEGRIGLWFDPHSQQFVHAFGAAPLNFCRFPHRSHE